MKFHRFLLFCLTASTLINHDKCPPSSNGGNGPVSLSSSGVDTADCGELIHQSYLQGRVDIVAQTSTVGLIALDLIDVFWLPYYETDISLDVHDIVYFKIQKECINNQEDTIVIAVQITKTTPDEICNTQCINEKWVRGRSVVPHYMFDHPGGGNYHKPGHIISTTTTKQTLQITEGSTPTAPEEYTLVTFRYDITGDLEEVYVPTKFIDELQGTTNYYLEFYSATVSGKKVLRAFSLDHTHPGHVTTVTINVL